MPNKSLIDTYPRFAERYPHFFDVQDYGARGDGVSDDTVFIQQAINDAIANGGGTVFFHEGTYITGTLTLKSTVHLLGAGIGATVLKLKNGANVDLLSAQTTLINLSAVANSGAAGSLSKFSIQRMTLDGNRANQTGGPSYPLRFYGYDFLLRDVEILNGYTGGVLIDWNGGFGLASPSDQMESLIDTVKIHDCNGIGFQYGGPHDSRINNLLVFYTGSHGIHLAPNAAGVLVSTSHVYQTPNAATVVGWLIENSGGFFKDCQSDGAYYTGVALLGSSHSWQGRIFNATGNWTNATGMQLGQNAGNTPYPGQINQNAGVTTAVNAAGNKISVEIDGPQIAGINVVRESNNFIEANIYMTTGSAVQGTFSASDSYWINVNGLTADGTLAKSGGVQINSSANGGFTINKNGGGVLFQLNGLSGTSGFFLPGALQLSATGGTGINTPGGSTTGLLIDPGANASKGLVIFPHSSSQSAALLSCQNASFIDQFTVDMNGRIQGTRLGINNAPSSGQAIIVAPGADANKGVVIYPNSSSQSAALLSCQNASFIDQFTVDKNGNVITNASLSVGQSSSAAAIANAGTITTSGISSARVAPTANVTGIILQAGTQAGQICKVVNESAFTVTFDVSGTSHVADGTSAVVAANRMMEFIWDSGTSLWYHS